MKKTCLRIFGVLLFLFHFFLINAANISSNGTGGGLWSAPATWIGGIVPGSSDAVTIKDGDVVTIDATATAFSLLIGEAGSGILQFEQTTATTLTVSADVTITTGGIFRSSPAGTQTGHNLLLSGNLINNGTLDFSTNADAAGAGITFTGISDAAFSGTGTTTDIRQITVNKGASSAAIIEISVTNFTVRGVTTDTVVGGWLVMSNGTVKISGTFSGTSRVFNAAGYTIPLTSGFWLNNPNYVVAGQNGSPTLSGLLRISQGSFNIGTATGNSMGFAANSSIVVEGGFITTTGRFGVAAAGNKVSYTQSGGTITVCTIGNPSATLGAFDLGTSVSSVIGLSGGTIVCQLPSPAIDYRNQAGTGIVGVTGGTLQLGNAASGATKTFNLRGVLPNVVLTNTSANHNATMSTTLVNYNNISLDITINGGTFSFGNVIFLFAGTTLTNNGTFTHNGANSNFLWFGNTAGSIQTYTGSGAITAPVSAMSIQNLANVTLNGTSQFIVNRVNFFGGGFINSNKLTLGNGGATTAVVQLGVAGPTIAVAGFDVPPVFNPGTGGVNLFYAQELTARTTGNEVPPSRTLNLLNITNPNTTTIAGGDITTTTLTMSAGNINTGASTLTVGTGLATPGTFTYATGTIIGKFKRWITPATGNRDFPVGTATAKRNASIDFTTAPAAGGSLTAEWVSSPGGSNGMPLVEGAIGLNNTSHDGYWRVVAGDGLTGGDYTGTFTATGVAGVNDYTQLVLVKRANGASPWALNGTHTATIGSNAIPVLSRTAMNGFSDFAVAGGFPLNPLPLTLLSFTAQRDVNVNRIKWSTAQEINSHHFILERSDDGRNYTPITQVTAAGNSSDSRYYSFTDNNPVSGINYYRLQMVDIDNSVNYSAVRIVRNEGIADVAIYPNPVKDVLNISVTADKAGKGTMSVTIISGHIVYRKSITVKKGNNNFPVDLGHVANGAYLITIQLSDDRVVTKFNKL